MPERDYSSFSSAAKSRFRPVAEALGYEQLTGTLYARQKDGWYEMFDLQAAQYGGDFFYVNYGIATPDLCPVAAPTPIRECGTLLGARLQDVDGSGGFSRGSKEEIAASATSVLQQFKKMALPWFQGIDSWDAIAAEFLNRNSIEEGRLGQHTYDYGEDLRCATYGYLLLKAGRKDDALRWLAEAHRIMSLPVYLTRDGRTVHEKEKYARLEKPEDHELEMRKHVEETIALIESKV